MSEYSFKLPDLGEGTVEAEIVQWHVAPGDVVREGDLMVDVMTDKANVEVPAPVDGTVLRVHGEPGELLAVGSELVALETGAGRTVTPEAEARPAAEPESEAAPEAEPGGEAASAEEPEPPVEPTPPAAEAPSAAQEPPGAAPTADEPAATDSAAGRTARKVITSPAIRKHAKEAGIDLTRIEGSRRPKPSSRDYRAEKVIGVRRVIAGRMAQSKRDIPHFAYVEEIDVTEVESLRRVLKARYDRHLTLLPFIALGLLRALPEFPQCNARYDAEANELKFYTPVHLGIATQTPDGLKVPVVHHAQQLDLWRLAEAIAEAAAATRDGTASRDQLAGSTITVTSLGRMGGIVTTPVINHPETSIIGINKAVDRPMVVDGEVRVRTMMNLSGSFDHRFVDGYDAAALIQRVKGLLETPAELFLDPP